MRGNKILKFILRNVVLLWCIAIISIAIIKAMQKEPIDDTNLEQRCTDSGIIFAIGHYGERRYYKIYKYHFYVNGKEIDDTIGLERIGMIYGYEDTMYVGKKVRVKYFVNDPSKNTLVSWEEPCQCGNLNQ